MVLFHYPCFTKPTALSLPKFNSIYFGKIKDVLNDTQLSGVVFGADAINIVLSCSNKQKIK